MAVHISWHACEGHLKELAFTSHQMGHKDQTQVVSLGGRCHYPPTPNTGPIFFYILVICDFVVDVIWVLGCSLTL